MDRLFLDALACTNKERPPIWLMRQAGRYMPSYRELRKKHSLSQLFHEPELAAQVAKMPIEQLGLDAAIVFSDIVLIAESLGMKAIFPEEGGLHLEPQLRNEEDIKKLSRIPVEEQLGFVKTQIEMLKEDLTVPLIGFCGGPFTVASYMLGEENRLTMSKTKSWLYNDPPSFHHLLELITEASIEYLTMQIEAGVDAIQIFDSWANVLAHPQWVEFSVRYLKQIVDALKPKNVPIILFMRGSSLFPQDLAKLKPAGISFDWQKDLVQLRQSVPKNIAVQGNLDPELLKAPRATIRDMTERLLTSMRGEPGFIAGLGHGVLPDTPIENVQFLIDTVKCFTLEAVEA